MSNSVLLLTLAIVSAVMLMANASPVDIVSVQPNGHIAVTPNTAPNIEQRISMSKYTAVVRKVVGAWQVISRVFHQIAEVCAMANSCMHV